MYRDLDGGETQQVDVCMLDGETLIVHVRPDDAISTVKAKLELGSGVSAYRQVVV